MSGWHQAAGGSRCAGCAVLRYGLPCLCICALPRVSCATMAADWQAPPLRPAGRHDEAVAAYRRSLALRPDFPEVQPRPSAPQHWAP